MYIVKKNRLSSCDEKYSRFFICGEQKYLGVFKNVWSLALKLMQREIIHKTYDYSFKIDIWYFCIVVLYYNCKRTKEGVFYEEIYPFSHSDILADYADRMRA